MVYGVLVGLGFPHWLVLFKSHIGIHITIKKKQSTSKSKTNCVFSEF